MFSSTTSTGAASEAARSFWVAASTEWLEVSLPALFLPGLPLDCRPPEDAETDVAFVAADNEAESRELVVVGVLVYVVDDADPRLGVKLARWVNDVCFFAFSSAGEPCCCWRSSSACPSAASEPTAASSMPSPRPTAARCELAWSLSLSLPEIDPWELPRRLVRRFSTPSHWPPALAGVLDRLVLPTLLCAPMLERARADLPETPSSFRSASTVAWSSMSDQPSWVPRSSECATWDADAEDAWPGCSLAAWALGAALLPVLAWRRNCWMDDDPGEGGRCE